MTSAEEFYYPPWKRLLFQCLVSLPVCLACLSFVFLVMLGCFQLQVGPGPCCHTWGGSPPHSLPPPGDPIPAGARAERQGAAPHPPLPAQNRAGRHRHDLRRGLQEDRLLAE